MNVQQLLNALENDQHDGLFHFTTQKIQDLNKEILSELHLSDHEFAELCNKLHQYKYVDEMNDLKCGAFVRWIPIEDPTHMVLTKGAFFCEFKITSNGVFCICKNIGNRHFRISMETNLLFQKLTNQELTLLTALDHIQSYI